MEARTNLRNLTRGAYDLQKLRIMTGNRLVANWYNKYGLKPGDKIDDHPELKNLTDNLRRDYRLITDGLIAKNGEDKLPTLGKFKPTGLISNYTELCMVAQYAELERQEKNHFGRLELVLRDFPIYKEFLLPIRGVGPAMSAVIISEFDIYKATYPSSMWKYAGLDVADDGKGRSKRKEHLVEHEYTDKEGEIKTKMGITFNPFLKSKLMGVLAASFIMTGKNPYRDAYDGYKNRLVNHPEHKKETPGHREAMARRFMIKRFLVDLYKAWRSIEGLPVEPEYGEGKLGIVHKKAS